MKTFIDKYCNFINFNLIVFIMLWYVNAVPYVIDKGIIIINILTGIIVFYIIIAKLFNKLNNWKLRNFVIKSPLNLVIGSLGTGKTALLVYISQLLKKKKYKIATTFPLALAQKLSLGQYVIIRY